MNFPLLAWSQSGSVFALLPSLVTVGPIALLAWLFPAVFGGLALFLRRGIVLCTVLASISSLYLLQAALRRSLAGTYWATPSAYWLFALAIAATGLCWSVARSRRPSSEMQHSPAMGPALTRKGALFSTERLLLCLLVMACGLQSLLAVRSSTPHTMELVWAFEPVDRGAIVATPLVTESHVYIGTIYDTRARSRGAVYAVNRATGKPVWRFDDDGRMLNMFSTPCLADGRLFIGEGMHADFASKLYCLDAADGHKIWEFATSNHIESSPIIADGRVFVGAGDDGIYCLDSSTGTQVWNFRDGLHIDASPVVSDGRVYICSGVSRRFRTTQVLCLDARAGQVRWRHDTSLPAWGSPTLVGDRVYFGLGNGRLLASAPPPKIPAGALLCVDAATGVTRFRFDVADAVLDRAVADARHVYFTSRDAFCYAVDRLDGTLLWRWAMTGPGVTTPALADNRLYIAPTPGPVTCLDTRTGQPVASFDLAKWNGTEVRLLSSPVVVPEPGPGSPADIIYLGSEVRGPLGSAGVLYAFRNPH